MLFVHISKLMSKHSEYICYIYTYISPILSSFVDLREFSNSTLQQTIIGSNNTCRMCGQVYSNRSNLKQHISLIHSPESVACPICQKPFKTKLYLRRHLKSFHHAKLVQKNNFDMLPQNGGLVPSNIRTEVDNGFVHQDNRQKLDQNMVSDQSLNCRQAQYGSSLQSGMVLNYNGSNDYLMSNNNRLVCTNLIAVQKVVQN